jgi:hypothetical protein
VAEKTAIPPTSGTEFLCTFLKLGLSTRFILKAINLKIGISKIENKNDDMVFVKYMVSMIL